MLDTIRTGIVAGMISMFMLCALAPNVYAASADARVRGERVRDAGAIVFGGGSNGGALGGMGGTGKSAGGDAVVANSGGGNNGGASAGDGGSDNSPGGNVLIKHSGSGNNGGASGGAGGGEYAPGGGATAVR